MTDNELRAAAIGILVYEHFVQTGGGDIESQPDGMLDIEADLMDGYVEAALQVCSGIILNEEVSMTMEAIDGEG